MTTQNFDEFFEGLDGLGKADIAEMWHRDLLKLEKAVLEINHRGDEISELTAERDAALLKLDAAVSLRDEWQKRFEGQQVLVAGANALNESYDEVLRDISSYVGNGGYNSDGLINPEQARGKIRGGIDTITKVEGERRIAAQSKLNERTKLVQAMMARLADLLDDDHFNNMEMMVLDAGVPYPDEEPPR